MEAAYRIFSEFSSLSELYEHDIHYTQAGCIDAIMIRMRPFGRHGRSYILFVLSILHAIFKWQITITKDVKHRVGSRVYYYFEILMKWMYTLKTPLFDDTQFNLWEIRGKWFRRRNYDTAQCNLLILKQLFSDYDRCARRWMWR